MTFTNISGRMRNGSLVLRRANPMLRRVLATILLFLLPVAIATAQTTAEDAALDEGRRLFQEGDYSAAREVWQPLADAGNPRALYNLATLYRKGLGVAKDEAAADRLLREAAGKGFNDARYVLADRLFSAEGADEAKRQEAARLWFQAASEGHGLSAYRVGLLYWNGEIVARDLVMGRAYMARADEAGIAAAGDAILTMDRYLNEEQRTRAIALAAELGDGTSSPAAGQAMEPGREAAASALPVKTGTLPQPAQTPSPARGSEASPSSAGTTGPTTVTDPVFHAGWRLQIIALRSEKDAEAFWQRLLSDAPDLVSGLDHRIVVAHIPDRGDFYRLQIGPFGDRTEADRRCRALKVAGFGCFAVAPDA